jgi:hypothetical protein
MAWARARGFGLIQSNGRTAEFEVKTICPHLKGGGCDLHGIGKHKPRACRSYPGSMVAYWEEKGLDPQKSLGGHCGYRYVPAKQ